MYISDKNSALSLYDMSIENHSALWYTYIINREKQRQSGGPKAPTNHKPYPREDEPTVRRTIAGKMLMGLFEISG